GSTWPSPGRPGPWPGPLGGNWKSLMVNLSMYGVRLCIGVEPGSLEKRSRDDAQDLLDRRETLDHLAPAVTAQRDHALRHGRLTDVGRGAPSNRVTLDRLGDRHDLVQR